jgi:hypothetical protein
VCTGAWHACLAHEFSHVDYFVVHHLTVAAYQVQHPEMLEPGGWDPARAVLERFLGDGTTGADARRAARDELARHEGTRRRAGTSTRPRKPAAMRLSQVRRGGPEVYCADIERYARAVLESTV